MAIVISAVIFFNGVRFHRRHDRPVLRRHAAAVFPRRPAILYLTAVVLFWAGISFVTTADLVVIRPSGGPGNALTSSAGIAAAFVGLVTVFRTARAISVHDPVVQSPLADLGRLLRVSYGTAAVAAWRCARGQTY